jgi:hypothetical protein
MIKSEIIKFIDTLRGDPDIYEVHTAEFPNGKWAPVILVLKKSGEYMVMKKKGLSAFDRIEVSRVVKTWVDMYGLDRKKMRISGMN